MLKILIIVLLIAVAIYLVARLVQGRGGSAPRRRPEPPRPVGPDDDPNFLRDLERKRRKPQKDEPDPS
ncbi:hypothetical protein [Nocardioides houyundeii]|uniref:hypothetical protein n=1 Tax=Nocardioides houyundeii TaxID=2045452 RepID=UPI000DF4A1FA|nr:hypothetical protein [Nocardioides houyundeii]